MCEGGSGGMEPGEWGMAHNDVVVTPQCLCVSISRDIYMYRYIYIWRCIYLFGRCLYPKRRTGEVHYRQIVDQGDSTEMCHNIVWDTLRTSVADSLVDSGGCENK